MRSATLWLGQLADGGAPSPLIPVLMERFDLRRRDAYAVASEWNNRLLGRPPKQYIPPPMIQP